MESVTLYIYTEVSLEEIALCVMRSFYAVYYVPPRTNILGVQYVINPDEDDPKMGYWNIWKSDLMGIYQRCKEELGDEELRFVEELQPISAFSVTYNVVHPVPLRKFLRALLQCYGGWIVYYEEGKKYSLDNIEEIFMPTSD